MCLDDFSNPELISAVETFKTFCKQCSKKGDFIDLNIPSQDFLKSTVLYLVEVFVEKYNCEFISDKVIIEALKQMHEKIGQKFSISALAKNFSLSTDGFIRKFKRILGETPYSYMKKLKIRTAQNMRQNGANLQEIAERCGYADASSLLHAIGPKTI
jgi:AraC-like DNA-binding protein